MTTPAQMIPEAALSAYQRDLRRSMLGPLIVFAVAEALLVAACIELSSRWSSRYWAWGTMAATVVAAQLTMAAFRKRVARASKAHGLLCPSCNAVLGFRYATLRRTGICRNCGRKVLAKY